MLDRSLIIAIVLKRQRPRIVLRLSSPERVSAMFVVLDITNKLRILWRTPILRVAFGWEGACHGTNLSK